MATFPSSAKILLPGFGEGFDPSVLRTEMERGLPKERLLNSQVLMRLPATIYFRSADAIDAFDAWYFNEIKRIGWFDFRHPRTREVVVARFEKGNIGVLTPQAGAFALATRDVVLEYLR